MNIKTWDDFYGITAADIAAAKTDELHALINRLYEPMDYLYRGVYSEKQEKAISRVFFAVNRELDERFREEEEPKLLAYFNKYFRGKSVDQINKDNELINAAFKAGKRGDELPNVGDWDYYSDWHKDVYGFRPHGVVCGTYVRPF